MPHNPTDDELRRIHREILAPAFIPDELYTEDRFVQACRDDELRVLVRRDEATADPGGQAAGDQAAVAGTHAPVAVAVGAWFEESRVLLLVWLAVRPGARGGGLGRAMLTEALEAWQRELSPSLVLGEVEHPLSEMADAAHGDPARRLGFYDAFGVRALPLAHLQPACRPGGAVVGNLVLCVFRDDGTAPGESVAAAPVRGFVRAYLAERPDLAARVLAGVDADRLPTIPLTAVDELPNAPRG